MFARLVILLVVVVAGCSSAPSSIVLPSCGTSDGGSVQCCRRDYDGRCYDCEYAVSCVYPKVACVDDGGVSFDAAPSDFSDGCYLTVGTAADYTVWTEMCTMTDPSIDPLDSRCFICDNTDMQGIAPLDHC